MRRSTIALSAAVALLVIAVAWREREGYDPKNFLKHGDWHCPFGYTWGTGDQTGKCCRVGTDLGAPAGEDDGNCRGAVQKTTSADDARTIVKNWCLVGSSLADVERKKPEVAALTRKDPDFRKQLNQVCEENRAEWARLAAAGINKRYKNRDWKQCPNEVLRVTRPRKIAGMCCRANKSGCMDAGMFGATAGVASLKRRSCPKNARPTCGGGTRPRCDRPAKGQPYQWVCPSTDAIVYYQKTNQGGDSTTEYNEVGTWYDMPDKWHNKISSLTIPQGRRIQIFQYHRGKENGGESAVLGAGTYNLTEVKFPSGQHYPGEYQCDDKQQLGPVSYTDPAEKNRECWNDSVSAIKVLA